MKKKATKRRYQKEKLLERMKRSQDQQEGGRGVLRPDVNVSIWRPKDGSHIIDIIPYIVGKNNSENDKPGVDIHYTFRYFMHRNVGPNNAWVICPAKTWGEDCPICEYRQSLIDKGADWDKQIKPLFPKSRNLYNIVCYDRGEEKKGVQVWDVSNHYFEKHIVTLSKKPARGGKAEKKVLFFDEEEGKSISFTIEPAQSQDDYPEYVAHSFEDRDYKISNAILDSAHCLDELVVRLKYEELKRAFFGKGDSKKKLGPFEESDDDIAEEEVEDDWDNESNSSLLEDLEDCENNIDLKHFCKENKIKFKFGEKFSLNLRRLKKQIEEAEEEEEPEEEEDDITSEEVMEMSKKEIRRLIKDRDLDIDIRDFDDIEELKEEVIEVLFGDD